MYSFPFKWILKEMVIAVVEKAVKDLNQFPARGSIAKNMGLLTIMI